ncbi:hypothetical protein FACS189451_07850 [Bacteroidia bacterium]|nr:hypothetical protein FACS189451_07850 [Bacteroidia bacterium]
MKPVEIEFLMRDRLSGGIDNVRMKTDLLDASLKRMAATVGTAFTLTKAIEFGKVMMDVRGQIESFQISFETLIGSKDKAGAFFSEIKDFATKTPLMLDDLAKNAQTLLGFGVETEKVIPILKQIGDVTMGNKDRFNAMSLAFSQMYATGKLMGQDLLQMVNAGFNPLKIISEQTGKSISQLKDEMSDGAISAEMVAQAFADVTAEGGKFHGMLQKQSEGINGMKAQFQGAIQDMLNEMGESSQKLYTDGLNIATTLVKNYETVGKVLVGLIATYGSYKAAVIAVTTVEKAQAISRLAHIKGMTTMGLVTDILKAKTAALNKTMLANPYVLVATAVVALGAALWALRDSTSAEEKAQKKLNETMENAKQQKENLKGKTNELISIIKDETQTIYAQVKAYEELRKVMPKAFEGMSREQIAALSPEEISKMINRVTDSMEFDAVNKMFTDAQQKVADLQKQFDQLMSAPSGTPGGNAGGLMYLSKQIEKAQKDMEAAKKQLDEMNKIKIQSEFDEKPIQERIAYYETEIAKLDTQKRQLDTLLITNKDIVGQWGQINFETLQNVNNLEFVNNKLNEMKGKLSTLQALPANTNYGDLYDTAKKDWEAAKKVLNDINKDKKKYTKEQYENAKTAEATAKKTFGDLGGDVSSSKKSAGSGLSPKEKANQLKAERAAREQQINDYTASLVSQQKQSEFDIRQARIDAMKEGIDKEKAAIKLHYDKLMEENRLREEKWVKELQSKTNLAFENENPDWKKKGLEAPKVSEKELTSEQQKQLKDYTDSAIQYRQAAEEKMLKDNLKQYEAYAQRYFDIQKKYQDEIDLLRQSSASEESIGLAEQAQKDAMTALDEEFAQKEETFKDLMARIGYMTLLQLEKTLKDAENALKKSDINNGKDSKQSATQRAKIKKLQEEIKAVKAENEIKDSDQLAKWKKTEKAIKDCKSEIDGMLDSMDFLDEETKSALQAASNVANGAIAMINGIKMLSMGASASISAVEKASVILMIVGAAIQIITAIFNMASAAEARHQEALKEIAREKTAFQREYNLLLIEQNKLLKQAETIFGVDAYGKSLGYIQQMKEAFAGLSKELQGEAPNPWEYFLNPIGYREALKNYEKGIKGLADIQVKTGHEKTGLFGWGKGRDIYSSILEIYPKLIDENGKFNASLAETIMNTRTLSDEDKATLQQMIDLSQLAEEAFQAVKDYLSDIFGELGNTISDALVDAFRNGTDAAGKFVESVTSMLEKLAEQMIYSVTIAPYLAKAQEDMLSVMQNENLTDAQKFNNYVGVLDGMMDGVLAQQGAYNSLLEQYRQMAAYRGLNLWESDSKKQSGKAGAYEAASQDSITRLEGLYSAMLEHEISIDHGVENIIESMVAALELLKKIEENTSSSDEHLDKIEKAMETMKDDIATIKRDGIRTR